MHYTSGQMFYHLCGSWTHGDERRSRYCARRRAPLGLRGATPAGSGHADPPSVEGRCSRSVARRRLRWRMRAGEARRRAVCRRTACTVLFSMWRRLTAATLSGVESAGRCEGAGAGADRPPVWDL
jgi:hypothetical protein